jgi:hypothetical protein
VGSFLGGAVGNALLPGVGGILGEEIGKVVGQAANGIVGQMFDQFSKDPIGTMADPASLPSKFVDGVLQDFGVPKQFRTLAQFATDPMGAIGKILQGQDQCTTPPVAPGGNTYTGDDGLNTNGKDTVDTGRYLISAQEGEVKIYDKKTNTWVQAQGDPHLSTSDGDRAQFQKNLTIDLPDGSEVKIKTTPQDSNGVSYIDKVAVLKGDEAVVMTGFHDGKQGVNVGHVLNNADAVAGQWSDGTVLRAGRNVSDLTFASDGKEIIGGNPSGRWGEWSLDGHGGTARYDNIKTPPNLLDEVANALKGIGSQVGTAVNGVIGLPANLFDAIRKALQGSTGAAGGAAGGASGGGNGGAGSVGGGSGGSSSTGGASGASDSSSTLDNIGGGSSILAVLMQLARKERNELFDKVNQLKNLKVPGKDASPQEQADFESTRDELKASIQSLQSEVQTTVTMATNLEKNDHDTEMSIARNLA